MPALPDQPLVHRSWLTRGLFSPAPWAVDAHALLMDTQLTFSGHATYRNTRGGTREQDVDGTPLTVWGHVEIEENSLLSDSLGDSGVGFVMKRHYLIIMPTPADTDLIPVKMDRVQFTDAIGVQRNMVLTQVSIAENMPGHLELTTDEFE